MIWGLFFLITALAAAYLIAPFLVRAPAAAPEGLDEARAQRAAVDADAAQGRLSPQAATEARDAIDRRILAMLDAPVATASGARLKSLVLGLVPAVLLIGGVGIYLRVGTPNFEPISFAEYQAQQAAEMPDSLDALVIELEARLAADPNPPADGYVLLARSYFRLGQVEAGLAAYDRAIALSEGAEAIVSERDRVIELLQNRAAAPQIDAEARARIEAMSADEQAAMIANMVDGLAMRLEQDPNDIEGWMRLIRARAVMGEVGQARRDLAAAHAVFTPDTDQGRVLTALAADLLPQE